MAEGVAEATVALLLAALLSPFGPTLLVCDPHVEARDGGSGGLPRRGS